MPEREQVSSSGGVGLTIGDIHPWTLVDVRQGGPADQGGIIKVGDELLKVDSVPVRAHLTNIQVLTLLRGPVGSLVELQFKEKPQRSTKGAYRVRLVRQLEDDGQAEFQDNTKFQDNTEEMAAEEDTSSDERCRGE